MKERLARFLVVLVALIALPQVAHAARVRVVRRGNVTRVRVVTHAGFPIRRALPEVIVKPGPVIRVEPRVYLAPIAFGAVVVREVPPERRRVWTSSEGLSREDGWTDFTVNVERRGERLYLDVDRGAAQISFAEVVFENGETQVIDFDDHVHARGTYELLNAHGRAIDHIRVVAKADTNESLIRMYLA